jgi:hypothetical protein
MIAGLIVCASLVLTLAFLVAWMASPALRVRIERPKYRFLHDVSAYDRVRRLSSEGRERQGP